MRNKLNDGSPRNKILISNLFLNLNKKSRNRPLEKRNKVEIRTVRINDASKKKVPYQQESA